VISEHGSENDFTDGPSFSGACHSESDLSKVEFITAFEGYAADDDVENTSQLGYLIEE